MTDVAPRLLRIQEVAEDTGLTPRAIRYYEEVGLLAPAARSEGAYRLYDGEDLERLRFIRGLRDDAGFSLAEIRQLLEDEAAREPQPRPLPIDRTTRSSGGGSSPTASTRVDRQVASLRHKIEPPRGDDRARPRTAAPTSPATSPTSTPGREPSHGHDPLRRSGRRRDDSATAAAVTPRAGGFALANGGRAFRHRNYRLFFGGQLVSLVGTWMQQVAQAWLVLAAHPRPADPRAHDGAHVPARARARAVRRDHRGRPAQAPDADGHPGRPDDARVRPVRPRRSRDTVQVWQILVLATLLGITNAVDMPTRQAFTVEMVGREDVANAVALNSAVFNGARIVGPAIAGLTIGFFGGDVVGRVPGQRVQLPRGDRRLRGDARRRAPLTARASCGPSSVGEVRTSARGGPAATSGAPTSCCWRPSPSASRRRSASTSASSSRPSPTRCSTPTRPGTAS